MQNQNIEKYTEESPLAEEGRKLFKRLYGNAEGEAKFELDDTQEQFVHALLQEMLYNIVQYSDIPGTYDKGYINDGCAGNVLDYDTLHNEQSFLARADDGPGCTVHYTRLGNPYTKERLYISTVYFHDIKNPETKIIRLDYEHFLLICGGSPGSIAYKQQYEEALNVLKGQKEMPNWVPQEIKGFVVEYQLATKVITQEKYKQQILKTLDDLIKIPSTPDEIKKCLKDCTDDNAYVQKFTNEIKTLLESDEFKKQYADATSSFNFEAFKDFVYKAIAYIKCALTYIDAQTRDQQCRKIDMANKPTTTFRNYVTSKLEESKDSIGLK